MAYEKQDFFDGQVLTAEHLNHMEDGFDNILWNDLKDKPFGEVKLEDFSDLTNPAEVYFDALGLRWYKVSDLTLTYDQMLCTDITIAGEETSTQRPTAEDCIINEERGCAFQIGFDGIIVAYQTGLLENDITDAIDVPETGIYVSWNIPDDENPHVPATVAIKCDYVKKLNEKFLPEADALPVVTADDNGKILSVVEGVWAAADADSGESLPAVTTDDNGKVLKVADGVWALGTDETGGESSLPEVTADDNGKVLSVVDGTWAAAEAAAGSGSGELNVTRVTLHSSDTAITDGASNCFVSVINGTSLFIACMFTLATAFTGNGSNSFEFTATVSEELHTTIDNILSEKMGVLGLFMNGAFGGTMSDHTIFGTLKAVSDNVIRLTVIPATCSLKAEDKGYLMWTV